MRNYQIPYGAGQVSFELPEDVQVDWIAPPEPEPEPDPRETVRKALDQPVGDFRWEEFSRIQSVAIAVNDKTRPVPHEVLLPPLLRRLETIGLPQSAVHFFVASGTHVPMPASELHSILPQEILGSYPVTSHDCDDAGNLVSLGQTSRGTPVTANKAFLSADLRIVVGNIEPHHFMGYSGGVKSAAVGLVGRETINRNHSMLTDPHAFTGHYDDNPMRMDVEEIGHMMGIQLAVTALLTRKKEIVAVTAGSPVAVMRVGIPLVKKYSQVPARRLYDLVIASPGGAPKDINFYQSEKALTHAAMFTRAGGRVILVADCPEGIGSLGYEQWISGMSNHQQVIERFSHEGFRIGPHKAFQVARIASRIKVSLYSSMTPAKVREILLEPSIDLQMAIDNNIPVEKSGFSVAVLPYAVSTIPITKAA